MMEIARNGYKKGMFKLPAMEAWMYSGDTWETVNFPDEKQWCTL
jgi:hypothetical protein